MICGCPIDTRRGLFKNIVLSGGSTMFPHFGRYVFCAIFVTYTTGEKKKTQLRRLQRDIKSRVDARMEVDFSRRKDKSGGVTDIEVNVLSHSYQVCVVLLFMDTVIYWRGEEKKK